MEIFDGRKAAEEYMSAHTLTFSTPDLTLKRFAFWLGDMIPAPDNKEVMKPRIYSFVEEKDFAPVNVVDEESFSPSGAVRHSSIYGGTGIDSGSDSKFCSECGGKMSSVARFCPECGTTQ
ncbi:hypothetical protein CENSYa_0027 [Cenarchaeum symbiosum A]|uniref:Zinc-ribbon domain-containing protein n=1 Tax=Cenarchaeum symbiosum (strain A) TaxID=414004 RepID=A0RTL8_CENSY|nr:hypothetical protein CENSYa_0027 [Cenarchaeum symbiosum A]